MKQQVKRNQLWKSSTTGVVLRISNKATGNRHWTAVQVNGKKSRTNVDTTCTVTDHRKHL